jgi:hypothetical protein
MSIKNTEAHELAKELARVTGESLTEAVTTAVRGGWNASVRRTRASGRAPICCWASGVTPRRV